MRFVALQNCFRDIIKGVIIFYLRDTLLDQECKLLISWVCVRQPWVTVEEDIIRLW